MQETRRQVLEGGPPPWPNAVLLDGWYWLRLTLEEAEAFRAELAERRRRERALFLRRRPSLYPDPGGEEGAGASRHGTP